ncbi:MAG: hypothetical protein RIF46_17285, partial [Cyclobacteriaceae bacterium]
YKVRYFPNAEPDGTLGPGWMYISPEIKKSFSSSDLLCTTEDMIINLVSTRRSVSATKISFEIQGLSIDKGEERFKVSLNETYNNQPFAAYYNKEKGTINLLGLFYSPDVKALKDNGLGLFNHEISLSGEILDEKYLFWTNEFRDFMKISDDGMALTEDQKGFLYFHKIIKHEDGSIVAVAEQYQKKIDGAGIALNIAAVALGGGASASTTKIQIYDMVLFHFNPDFSIRNVEFIPKTKSNFTLPSGYDFTNVHLLAKYVKAFGGFDYLFSTQNETDGTTSIAYLDYEKRTEGPGKQWVFHAVTLYDDEFTKDKIEIGRPTDAKNIRILPGKPGNVVVLEYLKEEEAFNVYIEKINY